MEKLPHLIEGVYKITGDGTSSPLVLDSPHSGSNYPTDFGYACSFDDLKKCEDHFVDLLFEDATCQNGVVFLKALFPRTYIDPNRAESDIAEDLRPADWPHITNPTLRSTAGHGLIRQTIGQNIAVYDHPLTTQEINHRLTHYYHPYHSALDSLLSATLQTHGIYFHINCHSSPPSALRPFYTGPLPDFVLGDMDGTSCGVTFRRSLQSFLIGLGYRVSVNLPYKGVEIVRRYGEPSRGKHSLQIEINKDLYLTSENQIIERRFNKLKEDIQKLIHHLHTLATSYSIPQAAD